MNTLIIWSLYLYVIFPYPTLTSTPFPLLICRIYLHFILFFPIIFFSFLRLPSSPLIFPFEQFLRISRYALHIGSYLLFHVLTPEKPMQYLLLCVQFTSLKSMVFSFYKNVSIAEITKISLHSLTSFFLSYLKTLFLHMVTLRTRHQHTNFRGDQFSVEKSKMKKQK